MQFTAMIKSNEKSDVDKVPLGAIAAYGFNYFEVGYLAGKISVRKNFLCQFQNFLSVLA